MNSWNCGKILICMNGIQKLNNIYNILKFLAKSMNE